MPFGRGPPAVGPQPKIYRSTYIFLMFFILEKKPVFFKIREGHRLVQKMTSTDTSHNPDRNTFAKRAAVQGRTEWAGLGWAGLSWAGLGWVTEGRPT